MPPSELRPVLYIVACGARPAGQLPAFVSFAQELGWEVCVVATPDGTKFLDAAQLTKLTGYPVRSQYKQPDEPDVLPLADAMAVVPASFNTINKWAQGISDTLALGLLNEAVGLTLPLAAVPWPNVALARHPAFIRSVATLREWRVRIVLDQAWLPRPTGAPAAFPWQEARAELVGLRKAVEDRASG